jgi:transcription antitermination protein NusB
VTTAAAHSGNGHDSRIARSAARLAAVQAIYQMELTGVNAEAVLQEFVDHRFAKGPEAAGKPDEIFFGEIVRGVPRHQVEIDRSIAGSLSKDWKLQRIDSILRAILRAATYELIAQKSVPAKVVIDEYLDVAHAFFAGEESAFVNAVLDRLAHRKRAAEFGETPPDDELQF